MELALSVVVMAVMAVALTVAPTQVGAGAQVAILGLAVKAVTEASLLPTQMDQVAAVAAVPLEVQAILAAAAAALESMVWAITEKKAYILVATDNVGLVGAEAAQDFITT